MKDAEDEAFDELARKQGMWGGGFQSKRAAAADKLQDGKCKYCVDGCAACDARAQPAQEPVEDVVAYHADGTRTVRIAAKRTWVGLTDDEHCDIWYKESLDWMEYGKAIEAKLKEKNT